MIARRAQARHKCRRHRRRTRLCGERSGLPGATQVRLRRELPSRRWAGVDLWCSDSRRPPRRKSSSQRITRAPARPAAERRGKPSGSRADDQHIAMGGRVFVMVGIWQPACRAEPGRAADQRLVDFLPERRRPHEGLVVEAADKERREKLIDRENVELERRPAILADRVEPVIEFDSRRLGVGLSPRAAAQRRPRRSAPPRRR